MKLYQALVLSLIIVLSMLPTTLAVGTPEKVAVVVSTPADAIVAAPYAKAMGYNLIYTPRDELSEEVEGELTTGGYTKVIIVGGPVAVSEDVEKRIKDLKIKTERIWGDTRVETSIEVFKVLKKEKPQLLENIVVTDGFNEKISPIAVSFNAPVLYYGLGREDKVVEVLNNMEINNTVILGERIPRDISNEIPKISKHTFIAGGSPEDVIKTAISFIGKVNPEAKNKDAVIVYAEKTREPIIKGVLLFVKDDASMLIPLPSKDIQVVSDILLKIVEITYKVLPIYDDPELYEIIDSIAEKLGIVVTLSVVDTGGGTRGISSYTTTPTGPVVTIVAGGKKIVFMGQDEHTLRISGDYNIHVPELEGEVKVVDKRDTQHNLTIDFRDNRSVEAVIEEMNNFNVVAYLGSDVKIKYYNLEMEGKNISLHVITERKSLRKDINNLLKGDAKGLIERLNRSYVGSKTVGSDGSVEFTYRPSINGEQLVVITEGDGVSKNAGNVKVLAVGGFEVVKYRMRIIDSGINNITNQSTYTVELNETPENPVRYGAVIFKKDTKLTLKITGTDPNNNLFNVSIVGDRGEYQIVNNNDFIKLSASKVKEIINKTISNSTASATYRDVTTNTSVEIDLQYIPESYLIAIAYDTETKKVIAVAQKSLD